MANINENMVDSEEDTRCSVIVLTKTDYMPHYRKQGIHKAVGLLNDFGNMYTGQRMPTLRAAEATEKYKNQVKQDQTCSAGHG